jgi:uncharacterized tellurite resistance protein B-like protein
MPIDDNRILVVTDLLLGAAHADKRFEDQEAATVQQLMRKIIADDSARTAITDRIEGFDPENFDLAETAASFAADPIISKRNLLELVSAVSHADEELDLAEDEYLHDLADALGVSEDEYADLALDYEVETLQQNLDIVVNISVPPPIPEK